MDRDVQSERWSRYQKTCSSLGYPPEATVDHQPLERYEKLYNKYCTDNGIHLDRSRGFDEQVQTEKLSQALYYHLCEILGYQSIINIRRTLWELRANVMQTVNSEEDYLFYFLGGKGEGFRLFKTDYDCMFVYTNQIILDTEASVADIVISNKNTDVLVAESSQPGHVRLRLRTVIAKNPRIAFSLCALGGKKYISSAKFREYTFWTSRIRSQDKTSVNGPCIRTIYDNTESDIASCLEYTPQPKVVQDWMERCKKYPWPSIATLENCMLTKCQLAPVGAKGSPEENLEWRISFILFEKKLVYSLNHCQFLCYGMLKLFLHNVLNHFANIKDLLSSYVMKTVLFWEIQTNCGQSWEASTLLENFSLCLQRLYRYVEKGDCPHFFVPENNIFRNKVFGEKQQILQDIIESLSQEKFYGLYKCNSIDLQYLIFQAMINDIQTVSMFLDKSLYVTQDATQEELDDVIWTEATANGLALLLTQKSIYDLSKVHHALEYQEEKDGLSDFEKEALKAWKSEITIYMTLNKFEKVASPTTNTKESTSLYKSCRDTLREHDHKGSFALLCLATLMFVTGRYSRCLAEIGKWLNQHKETYFSGIYITSNFQLPELMLGLESTLIRQFNDGDILYLKIHPDVYALFLTVLAFHKLGEAEKANIQFWLLREKQSHMPITEEVTAFQEIHWQLLGICAEVLGNYEEAFSSYVEAFKSPRFVLPDNAPLIRILCVIFKCRNSKG